jgi:acyl-CoA reductase-like NAD-dependent aldehyde dehydrogenase
MSRPNRPSRAARDAFPAWSKLTLEQRGEWMLKLAAALMAEREKLAEIMALETGKFYNQSYMEDGGLERSLNFFPGSGQVQLDETIRDPMDRNLYLSIPRAPGRRRRLHRLELSHGQPLHELGAVLASGCTAVIKPATRTPLSTLYIGEIMQRIGFRPRDQLCGG